MSVLSDYLRRAPSTDVGYKTFIDDMAARHAHDPVQASDHKNWVRCRWYIEFRSGLSKTETEVMKARLAAIKRGDITTITKPYTFETYHLLITEDAHRLSLFWRMRAALLPFATFGVLVVGLLLLGWLAVVLVILIGYGGPKKNGWTMPVGLVVGALLFTACLKAQLFLRKIGRPSDTDDFDDQRLKLQDVEIIS